MGFLQEFFPSGPPRKADPPSDSTVVQNIHKLVQYAGRNGPSFVALIKKNQLENPEYSFVFPGDPAYPYFMYSLWQEVSQEKVPKENWIQLLSQLNGSELSIKKCQGWFMSFAQYAPELCGILVQEAVTSKDPSHTVNLILLIDDILQRLADPSCSEVLRNDVTGAFGVHIPRLADMSHDFDEGQRMQLVGIVKGWDRKRLFSPEALQKICGHLEKDPHYFDPLSFPASLIPELCRESLEVYPPYSPLDPEDVKACNVPSSPTMDAYLEARIKSFYDLVSEYRPGLSVDDLHVGIPKQPMFERASQGPSMLVRDDGSYHGGRVGNAKGLGYGTQDGSNEAFDAFRKMSKYSSYKAGKS